MVENEISVYNKQLPDTIPDLAKFVLVGREKLVSVRAEIRAIEKVGLAEDVRIQKLEEAQIIGEALIDAEMKLGALMAQIPKATRGTGGNRYQSAPMPEQEPEQVRENNSAVNFSKTKEEVGREIGLTPIQVSRFQTLAAHPDIVEKAKQEARESGRIVTREAILKDIKSTEREKDLQQQIDNIENGAVDLPNGLFDVIAIDPPWNYGTAYNPNGRRVANPYPEMNLEELKALEIPAADDCVMFLWTTQKFIWDAKELLDTWGFTYRAMFVWDKDKIGMGDLIRMQCEFCLIGIKGDPVFKPDHSIRDIIREPRREHSRKPEAFYELVENLCTGRKLDYFSREKRDNWESIGNDTEKFTRLTSEDIAVGGLFAEMLSDTAADD